MARNVPVNKTEKPSVQTVREQPGAEGTSKARAYGYTEREWVRMNAADAAQGRKQMRLFLVTALLAVIALFLLYSVYYVIFRSHDYSLSLPFDKDHAVYGFEDPMSHDALFDSFASDLCVTDRDIALDRISMGALSGALFDLSDRSVMYSKDAFTMRSPASMTKIMTAYVALKYGNLDDMVTVTDTAKEIEFGSSVCDIKTGDVLSLRQLLYGMIIASGNDAAMMVAEHVGGSVDAFVDMMNKEALALGATRTHFVNPHGLTADNHYTCVYDMYLMTRASMENDLFMDMISRKNFYAEYRDAENEPKAVTWETTNHYFTGEVLPPDNVIIYGGKTGTTEDAGGCLTLIAKDLYGNPYMGVLMHSADRDSVYTDMNKLLTLIHT